MSEGLQPAELNYDWMHDVAWSEEELAAAKRLAEIGRAALNKDDYTTAALLKLAPEVDQFLPLDDAFGFENEMRFRVAARARGILTGEIDPSGP